MHGSDVSEHAGDCERPIRNRIRGCPDPVKVGLGIEPDRVLVQYQHIRCRECSRCLEHRRRLWTARAIAEVRMAKRTWFGTLTVAPDHRFRAKMIADAISLKRRCEPLSSQSTPEQFRAIAEVLLAEVTRWIKRVRKVTGCRFRYLLVTEAHEDGFPHFHLLLHEVVNSTTKKVLESQWKLGFSHWRLTEDQKSAGYVCKYLAKNALTRVRASQRYGQPHSGFIHAVSAAASLCREAASEGGKGTVGKGGIEGDSVP